MLRFEIVKKEHFGSRQLFRAFAKTNARLPFEAVLNYQIAHCAATKVLFVLLCYRTNTTNTTIFLSNISKLKHNQIIKIQTQKHNFKINQIITIKAKKKETEDRSHLTHLDWVRDEDEQ